MQKCSQALKICKCLRSLSCGGVFNTLVLSITFVIIMYGVVCVQLAHFSLGDWKDISINHVIIIIKLEISTLPIVVICIRGCLPEMFVTPYSVSYCIYIPGKQGILCSLRLCSLWWVKIVGNVLACRSCSFVCTLHHRIIIIVQTYLKTLNLLNFLNACHWGSRSRAGWIWRAV